jgi:hypothetical protein
MSPGRHAGKEKKQSRDKPSVGVGELGRLVMRGPPAEMDYNFRGDDYSYIYAAMVYSSRATVSRGKFVTTAIPSSCNNYIDIFRELR